MNQVPTTPTAPMAMEVAVYGNLRSMTSQNVFGALVLERIAQWFTEEPNLSFSITNSPLPKSNLVIM